MEAQQEKELMDVLAELRRRYPGWRFGQLVANVAGWADQEVWEIEDQDLVEVAWTHLRAVAQREQDLHA